MEEDLTQMQQTWRSEKCCDQFMIGGDVFDLSYYINNPPNHWRHPSETQYPYCERESVFIIIILLFRLIRQFMI